MGSAALVTASPKGGVSLNINVNYLSKVATGGRVLIEAQVRLPASHSQHDLFLVARRQAVWLSGSTHVAE